MKKVQPLGSYLLGKGNNETLLSMDRQLNSRRLTVKTYIFNRSAFEFFLDNEPLWWLEEHFNFLQLGSSFNFND